MTRLSSCAAQWKMWLVKVFSVIYFTAVCSAQITPDGVFSVTSVFDESSPTSSSPASTEMTTVYEPPAPNLQLLSGFSDVFLSEKVEFLCNISNSNDWTFYWFRSQTPVGQTAEPKLVVTAAQSGSYSCRGQDKTSLELSGVSNTVKLTVFAKKPKPILTRSSHFGKMFPGESITFTCKVNESSGWENVWYHNGKEIQGSSGNIFTIVSIDHPHSGRYHCRGQRGKHLFYTEDSDSTTLQVSDPPKPSLSVLTPWLDVFKNEVVDFICDVDSDGWTVMWFKDREQLQLDPNMEAEDPFLNITSVDQKHQGDYACKARLESRQVTSGFSDVIHIKVHEKTPTPTLSKVPGFNPMYVGETVNMTCKVEGFSDWEYEWYKDSTMRLETSKTISIPLGLPDRGEYWCRAIRGETTSTSISEKIQQDVIEIPVPSLTRITQWQDVFPGEGVKLGCAMQNSSSWTYTWRRGGQQIQDDTVVSFDSNGATLTINSASAAHEEEFTCQGHLKDRSVSSRSSPGLTLQVYDKKPTVDLTQDPEYIVMFPGESVSFSCHIHESTGWEYLWFKDGRQLASGNKYSVPSVETTDKGYYTCRATRGSGPAFLSAPSEPRPLDVQGNRPKPSMTQQPDVDKVYVGESVFFQCKVELSTGWEYLWYKDGAQLQINSSSFTIRDAGLEDGGSYECMAIRDKTMYNTERSDRRILHVSEIPVPSLKLGTPWLDVFPTESVKMSCDMDGTSDWTYTWFRDGQPVQADAAVSFDSDAATLSISSASASHTGRYNCSARLKSRSVPSSSSSGLSLSVYDTKPRVTLSQSPVHNVMHTGDSVSFSCHVYASSGWKFEWYKDGSQLDQSADNHTIVSVLTTHTGSYQCRVKREGDSVFRSDLSPAVKLTVEERPRAHVILLTGWSDVFSTDSLVLQCRVQESQDTWNYTWFKAGEQINLPPSEKHTVTPQDDPEQSLYTCKGVRTGRPSYSKVSDSFHTRNLLLKRRVLLSISGCIFFGIIAVFLGCIILRIVRKPADDVDRPEETELFLTMAQLKDREDAPCPLAQYITDAELNAPTKEAEENGTICSEATPLPITSPEDPAVTSENHDTAENNGGLVSFKQ